MADDRKAPSRHRLSIDQKKSCAVTGVLEVISFDESCVIADTESGIIVVKGVNLHVSSLNLDNGGLDIDGDINSVTYEEPGGYGKNKASFFGKIFK